jgi:hypothetical protein
MQRIALLSSIAVLALAAAPATGQLLGRGAPVNLPNVGSTIGATVGADVRGEARADSQGPANASATGSAAVSANANANANSVLGATDPLAPVAAKPAKVLRGTIVNQTPVAKGRVKSKGAANASVNGLANANANSALGAAGSVALNAVADGTAVVNAAGETIGTVTDLVKNDSGAVVGVTVDLEAGGSATLPASTLALSGSTLTTTWVAKN